MHDNDWVVPPVVYRIEEAAEALRMSRDRCYELVRSGRLRSFKEGRLRLIPIAALQEYVDAASGGDAA